MYLSILRFNLGEIMSCVLDISVFNVELLISISIIFFIQNLRINVTLPKNITEINNTWKRIHVNRKYEFNFWKNTSKDRRLSSLIISIGSKNLFTKTTKMHGKTKSIR